MELIGFNHYVVPIGFELAAPPPPIVGEGPHCTAWLVCRTRLINKAYRYCKNAWDMQQHLYERPITIEI